MFRGEAPNLWTDLPRNEQRRKRSRDILRDTEKDRGLEKTTHTLLGSDVVDTYEKRGGGRVNLGRSIMNACDGTNERSNVGQVIQTADQGPPSASAAIAAEKAGQKRRANHFREARQSGRD